MAVALKYALTQMLLLPYDEVDPDAEMPPGSIKKEVHKKTQAAQVAPAPPVNDAVHVSEIVLGEVKTQSGQGAKGRWNRFYSKADDGQYYSTFDAKLGELMANLSADGDPVLMRYHIKTGPKGESRDVVAVEPANLPDEPGDADLERKGQAEIPF